MSPVWPFTGLQSRAYRVIYADPPWNFQCGKGKGSRHPERLHYPTMSLKDLRSLDIKNLAHPEGARLFLWATMPFLPHALELGKHWGFRYSTSRVWIKTWSKSGNLFWTAESFAQGSGYEVIGNPEPLLIFKIGRPEKLLPPKPKALIISPRREHSRKPDYVREEIALLHSGPRCELFARESHQGFDSWGNETTKFDLPLLARPLLPASGVSSQG